MSFFLYNLKRALISKRFILSMLIVIICIVVGILMGKSNIKNMGGLSLFFAGSTVYGLSPISLLPVIVCILPFSEQFMQDSENKFLLFETIRIKKIKYITIMTLITGISGALSMLIPYSILLFFNVILFGKNNIYIGSPPEIFQHIFLNNQLLYSLILTSWFAIFGFVYSIFGMASSLIFKKKIASLIVPFIYYFGGGIVFSSLNLSKFEPVGTFDLMYQSEITLTIIIIHLLILFFASIAVIYFYFNRKFENYI